ncbi:MAG: hypothetical protein DRJ42_07335 [Deltaproteobacteria bacterium]|nr:MAG: hypothetical protein DRJ42_07335 [Deltaproteobacteria bacterium]
MGRYSFVVAWVVSLITAAVGTALWVDPGSGTLRAVLAFEPTHVICHLAIFATLAVALARARGRRVAPAVVIFIAAAVAQEWAQSLALGASMSGESIYDIAVDTLGGVVGVLLWRIGNRRGRRDGDAEGGDVGELDRGTV